MSLYPSLFSCTPNDDGKTFEVRHNCNGNINFTAGEEVSEDVARLISFAIEEGKRQRSNEIYNLLTIK